MWCSLRAFLRNWEVVYVGDTVGVLSELPAAIAAYRKQQHRWTCGPAQLWVKACPLFAVCPACICQSSLNGAPLNVLSQPRNYQSPECTHLHHLFFGSLRRAHGLTWLSCHDCYISVSKCQQRQPSTALPRHSSLFRISTLFRALISA